MQSNFRNLKWLEYCSKETLSEEQIADLKNKFAEKIYKELLVTGTYAIILENNKKAQIIVP